MQVFRTFRFTKTKGLNFHDLQGLYLSGRYGSTISCILRRARKEGALVELAPSDCSSRLAAKRTIFQGLIVFAQCRPASIIVVKVRSGGRGAEVADDDEQSQIWTHQQSCAGSFSQLAAALLSAVQCRQLLGAEPEFLHQPQRGLSSNKWGKCFITGPTSPTNNRMELH